MRDDIATSKGKSRQSGPPDITDLGNDVFQIDTRMAGYEGITAGYLIRGSRPCLVETGTATSAPVVREALAKLGVEGADLATVVVTHIHLDHAGGVGDIAAGGECVPRKSTSFGPKPRTGLVFRALDD